MKPKREEKLRGSVKSVSPGEDPAAVADDK